MNWFGQLKASQRGSALIVSLIFLLLLTIVGVGAMQSATLQERMAGNTRDSNSAFQAAEAATRAAEKYLESASVGPFDGTKGLYRYCAAGESSTECDKPDWSDRKSNGWVKRTGTLDDLSAQPEYIIQQMPMMADPQGSLAADESASQTLEFYRITARGYGTSSNTMVVIQTMYRR